MNKKILLIDDDKFILQMYRTKLEKKGLNVEVFLDTDGDIAQRVLDAKPDLITLDIVIPNRDGLETARILKADDRTKNIPIIFLTNQGQLKDVEDAKQAGCSAYIIKATTKPYETVDYLVSFSDNIHIPA